MIDDLLAIEVNRNTGRVVSIPGFAAIYKFPKDHVMNRVLKQRFIQISRMNNFLLHDRPAPSTKSETPANKMIPARPAPNAPGETRRG